MTASTGTGDSTHPVDSVIAGQNGYFEDFVVGSRLRHARSATVTDVENNQLSKQMMNTAQAHWNERALEGGRVVFGLVTASLVLGLASQDTASHALAEVAIDDFRFLRAVRQGMTITAYSEVLECREDPEHADAGLVLFRHYGTDDLGELVFVGNRTLRIKRRSAWAQATPAEESGRLA